MAEIGMDIGKAIYILTQGELVAIPTETVYGLAGNALNPLAITKIFTIKNRPHFDPLIVHVANIQRVHPYVRYLPPQAIILADQFWPGPLTLLLDKTNFIPDIVTSGLDRVGIRCPRHEITQQLLASLPFPLAAPSANPFGYISPTNPAHVNAQLGDQISYILAGGDCTVGIESTIVGFENNLPVIYRLGGLSIESIEQVIGKVSIQLNQSSNPTTPGQLLSHYAPSRRLVLGNLKDLLKTFGPYHIGVLAFQHALPEVNESHQFILSASGDLEEAAQRLFAGLRLLDQMNIQVILAESVPERGLGRAINDRLRRAAK